MGVFTSAEKEKAPRGPLDRWCSVARNILASIRDAQIFQGLSL